MQSKALYLLATTSGLCLRSIIALHSSGVPQGRWLPASARSSFVLLSMSRGSSTSTWTSAPTSAISVAANGGLFQFSNPSNPPTITGNIVQDNDAEVLLQRRPFVIVEGRVVRDDMIRSLRKRQQSSSAGGGTTNVVDDDISSCFFSSDNFTSKQFLTSFPSGAYTTSRTVKAQRVLRLKQHLSRMAESARLMIGAELELELQRTDRTRPTDQHDTKHTEAWQGYNFLTDGTKLLAADVADGSAEDSLTSIVRQSLASGISSFEHLYPASAHLEKRITTLLFWERYDTNDHDHDHAQKISGTDCDKVVLEKPNHDDERGHLRLRVLSYVELLPSPPTGRIIAQLCRTQRANALAKDSQWVNDRKALERQKLPTNPPVHEVLLTTQLEVAADRVPARIGVLEGLSSNFFAITRDGVLYTASAEEGVLLGTLRAIVIRVCEENGIKVREEAPLLPESFEEGGGGGGDNDSAGRQWVGAFVSSTTRLALPLTDLIVPSSIAPDTGDDMVDIIRFSYGGMDGHNNGNTIDGHGSDGIAESLGLVVGEVKGGNGTKEDGGVVTKVPYKVGKCITVHDSKGTMKIIVDGVHSAVLGESECPW